MSNYNINFNDFQGAKIVIKNYNFYNKNYKSEKKREKKENYKEKKEIKLNKEKEIIDLINNDNFKFRPKKIQNLHIADAFYYLDNLDKATKIKTCMTYLEFFKIGDKLKLTYANACQTRLCPICSWRRSLKIYRETKLVFETIKKDYANNRFLFLTLTCKNISGENLNQEINNLLKGFKKLLEYKQIKDITLGYIRSLEVTYNNKTNEYHPHIHVLIHTSALIYAGRNYITHDGYINLWAKAMNLDYIPIINIKSFKAKNKGQEGKELAEICKYSVKYTDIMQDTPKDTSKIIYWLESSLSNRRLLGFGGTFKDIRKKLKIKDNEVLTTEDEFEDENIDDEGYKVIYKWHFEDKKYYEISNNKD